MIAYTHALKGVSLSHKYWPANWARREPATKSSLFQFATRDEQAQATGNVTRLVDNTFKRKDLTMENAKADRI